MLPIVFESITVNRVSGQLRLCLLGVSLVCFLLVQCIEADEPSSRSQVTRRPLILAHYMPWYTIQPATQAKPAVWGWHWTMDHFDPNKRSEGKRQIASAFYPLIGPYDSGDPQVIEYHLLLMKLAGIDGVIVDWYGQTQYRDYAVLNTNTYRLIQQVERLGMKFVICYEDQTIPALVAGGQLAEGEQVAHVVSELNWLGKYWFRSGSYVRLDDKPVLLSFGHAGLSDEQWTQCLGQLSQPVAYFSEHDRRTSAVGAFDWPVPSQGVERSQRFTQQGRQWQHQIPVVFPRFVDIYAQAGVNEGYGRIEDNDAKTLRSTLKWALDSRSEIVQVATWNDWGEGTQIEPSHEFGYRDLEIIQSARRGRDAKFLSQESHLRFPFRLFQLRRSGKVDAESLDQVVRLIADGELDQALVALKSYSQDLSPGVSVE
ncbi:glycoside hydrolase family 71/99-like protein [Stieleria varia]|uniref:Glycosyl hydrolase family 71 n=1 Tax=Stieleria varia TaxID=2528005 RepID=A0A5C6ALP1_9BACT|nr:glycoside hydrolase family 71/99-like protein [Stieleria varia]TWU00943.1 hypothetical protein Pla52n_43130 [Stieleria varia]